MECFGRLMSGLAPWLSLPDDETQEGKQRKQLREWALQSYAHSVDPKSPDYLLWHSEGQPLVDSAFFSNALIRAPKQLWEPQDKVTKERIISELKQLRRVKPPYSNWLLFAAMNEAFFKSVGDLTSICALISIRKMNEWLWVGWYMDGERFHLITIIHFVIQPSCWRFSKSFSEQSESEKKSVQSAFKKNSVIRNNWSV